MKIVCAQSVLYGKEAFSTLGQTDIVPDHSIACEHVKDADLLIVRSKTNVDRDLLERSPVVFVGSTTSGSDHIDLSFLEEREVAWSIAPGCNANSVAEYVVSVLLWLSQRFGLVLSGLTLGVVGVGHIGGRVVEKARRLGMQIFQNDPPRAEAAREPIFKPLAWVLENSDMVTLHVPLTDHGLWPTRRMANHRFFQSMKPGAFFINASRAGVVDTDALLFALEREFIQGAVLDVWEDKSPLRQDVVEQVELGTPHIAGHSWKGRIEGTTMVYRDACHFLEVDPTWMPPSHSSENHPLEVDALGCSDEEVLWQLVRRICNIEHADQNLRKAVGLSDQSFIEQYRKVRSSFFRPKRISSSTSFPQTYLLYVRTKDQELGISNRVVLNPDFPTSIVPKDLRMAETMPTPRRLSVSTSPRYVACCLLCEWLKSARFPDRMLNELESATRVVVRSWVDGVVRWYGSILWAQKRWVKSAPRPYSQGYLLIGLYQLLFASRNGCSCRRIRDRGVCQIGAYPA